MPHQTDSTHHSRSKHAQSYYAAHGDNSRSYSGSYHTNPRSSHYHYRDYSNPSHYDQSRSSYRTTHSSYYSSHNQYSDYRSQQHYRHSREAEFRDQKQGGLGESYQAKQSQVRRIVSSELPQSSAAPSYLQHSNTPRKSPAAVRHEEHNPGKRTLSHSDDDSNESAEEAAVSALLLSAGGSRTNSSSDPEQRKALEQDKSEFCDTPNQDKPRTEISAAPNRHSPQQDIEEAPYQKESSQASSLSAKVDGVATQRGTLPTDVNDSHFPPILHQILTSSEFAGTVLEWLPHGQAWRVLRWDELAKSVLPFFFPNMCQDKGQDYGERMNCFLSHIRSWGFQEVRDIGPDMGAYWHNCFVKDDVDLCYKMHAYPPGGFTSKGPRNDQQLSNSVQQGTSIPNTNKISLTQTSENISVNQESNLAFMDRRNFKNHSFSVDNEKDQEVASPPRIRVQKSNSYPDESSVVSTSPSRHRPTQVSRTPSWNTSYRASPSRAKHYASSRSSHYSSSLAPNHGGLVPQSPPNEKGPHSQREVEPRYPEQVTSQHQQQYFSMPYSAPDRNSYRSSTMLVSPERPYRGNGQGLRSGRGGSRAYASRAPSQTESCDEPEKTKEQAKTQKTPVFSVSTRGKGNSRPNFVRSTSSSTSETNMNSANYPSGQEMYGAMSVHPNSGNDATSSTPGLSAAVAISRKTKRQRLGQY